MAIDKRDPWNPLRKSPTADRDVSDADQIFEDGDRAAEEEARIQEQERSHDA